MTEPLSYMPEREHICQVGRLLYDRGYVAANDGNISMIVEEGRMLITPAGVSKGRMSPDMLLLCGLDGGVLEGDRHPTSESKLHIEVYRGCGEARAVVHAHPPTATAFAVRREGLETPYLNELAAGLGTVPCTPAFALPSTEEVPESARPLIPGHWAMLLANHGALAWGADLWEAFDRLETVEHTARIFLNIKLLGGGIPLTEEETQRLIALRGKYQALKGRLEERHGS